MSLSIMHLSAPREGEDVVTYARKNLDSFDANENGLIVFSTNDTISSEKMEAIDRMQQLRNFQRLPVPINNGALNYCIFVNRHLIDNTDLNVKVKFVDEEMLAVKCKFMNNSITLGTFIWPKPKTSHTTLASLKSYKRKFSKNLNLKTGKPYIFFGEVQEVNVSYNNVPITTTNQEKVLLAKDVYTFFKEEKKLNFFHKINDNRSGPLIVVANDTASTKYFLSIQPCDPFMYENEDDVNRPFCTFKQIIKFERVHG